MNQLKKGDRVVCVRGFGTELIAGREYIVARDESRDTVLLVESEIIWDADRFRLADPPKPTRTVTIRGAFAIDAEGAYYIEDINGIGESFATSALEYARTRCFSPCIHSGYFRFDIEIPDPVEVVATVEEVK